MYCYQRNVHVYETDLMGIVHHSNYLRYCEEARVDWCRKNGLLPHATEKQTAVYSLSVYETRVKHVRPLRYTDILQVYLQIKTEGVRMIFQYQIKAQESDQVVCLAETVHCSLDENFRIKRLSQELTKLVENQKWTETWL